MILDHVDLVRHVGIQVKHAVSVIGVQQELVLADLYGSYKSVVAVEEVARELLAVLRCPRVELLIEKVEDCNLVGIVSDHELVHITSYGQRDTEVLENGEAPIQLVLLIEIDNVEVLRVHEGEGEEVRLGIEVRQAYYFIVRSELFLMGRRLIGGLLEDSLGAEQLESEAGEVDLNDVQVCRCKYHLGRALVFLLQEDSLRRRKRVDLILHADLLCQLPETQLRPVEVEDLRVFAV